MKNKKLIKVGEKYSNNQPCYFKYFDGTNYTGVFNSFSINGERSMIGYFLNNQYFGLWKYHINGKMQQIDTRNHNFWTNGINIKF